jgi:sensor histidine kinase YesM
MSIQAPDMNVNDEGNQRANQSQRVPPYSQQQAPMNTHFPHNNLPLYNNQPNVMYMYNSQPQGCNLFMYRAKTHLVWSVANTLTSFFFLYGLFCSIPALIYSFQATEDIESGDWHNAARNGNISRKLNIFSTVTTSTLCVIMLIILLVCLI